MSGVVRFWTAAMLASVGLACASGEPGTTGRPRSSAAPASRAASAARGAAGLDGLWEATLRFGPDVRGTLAIDGGARRAELAGRSADVVRRGRAVSFALPDRLGWFEGELSADGRRIAGHWTQPGGVSTGYPFASPVELIAGGVGGWRGEVVPLDDRMTLRLAIRTRGGQSRAFLRNPERNLGVFTGVSRVERDGAAVMLFGARRGAGAEELLATGHHDAEGDVLVLPLRGGTYDLRRLDNDSDSAFYPRGARPRPYRYAPRPALDDGWPVGTVEQAGLERAAIERFVQRLIDTPIDSVHAPEVHAVLIARRRVLVLEEYFHGFHRDQPHSLRSAAKSLTSVLVGAAMRDGAALAPPTRVYRALHGALPAGLEPRKRSITLEHLLTMSSGLDCDDSDPDSAGNEERLAEQTDEPDWWRYTLRLDAVRDPGRRAVYCSASPHLVGAVLRKVTGESLPRLFHRLVAEPLGIRRYHLPLTPTGEAYLGGGVHLLPRDFLKLGQLMLDGGVWRGRRVLGADWVRRSTAPRFDLAGIRYGYLWWSIDFPHRGRPVRAFYAAGNGGQLVMVLPELDLVVAILGGNYSDRERTYLLQRELVPRHILPAVQVAAAR